MDYTGGRDNVATTVRARGAGTGAMAARARSGPSMASQRAAGSVAEAGPQSNEEPGPQGDRRYDDGSIVDRTEGTGDS